MFTVTVGMPFWGLVEHEPLIIALFLPVVSCSNWMIPYTIKGNDWTSETSRVFGLESKREWDQPGPVQIEGKLRQVSEEASENIWNILRNNLHLSRVIPSMSDDLVKRLLHR